MPTPKEIKLRRAGGSVSATLPAELVDRFHLQAGDRLFVLETEQGILLTPYDPEVSEAMAIYRRGARKYRHALHELAQ